MFKFNFQVQDQVNEREHSNELLFGENECCESHEVMVSSHKSEAQEDELKSKINIGSLTLFSVRPKILNFENLKISQNSDLIPGVYEGGAKLWECTLDLLNYFEKNPLDWKGKKVLDLGCGCGLLGIYALKKGAEVHFQDYNEEVLTSITIPNVLLNCESTSCKFYSGDWSKYVTLTERGPKFDIILTSETIYNKRSQQKLLSTFAHKIKEKGNVFVAAKTYYFGVGGGLRQFEELIKTDKRFSFKTIWSSNDGVSREILELLRITQCTS